MGYSMKPYVDDLRQLNPQAICRYAEAMGWYKSSESKFKHAVYRKGTDKKILCEMVVPFDRGYVDYLSRVADCVKTLGEMDNLKLETIIKLIDAS